MEKRLTCLPRARLALLSTRVTQWDLVVWIYHLRLAGCLLFGIQLPIWLSIFMSLVDKSETKSDTLTFAMQCEVVSSIIRLRAD